MRVYNLSKKDISKILNQMDEDLNIRFEKKFKDVKIVEIDEHNSVILSEEFQLAKSDGMIFPFLRDEVLMGMLPNIVIDKGAIKFIINGADIMRPGLVRIDDEFDKGEIVSITEETYGKFIAVGKAKLSSSDILSSNKGIIIQNLHNVGDKLWNGIKLTGLI